MLTGLTLVVILALSSVKCNRGSPAGSGNRRLWHYHHLGAENGVDMTILHKHYKQLVARGAHVRAGTPGVGKLSLNCLFAGRNNI